MSAETALSRERAKRCKLCATGSGRSPDGWHYIMDAGRVAMAIPPGKSHVRCTCPDIDDLYEELAKERDGLRENRRKQISERDKIICKLRAEIHEWEESDAAAIVLKPTLSEAMDEIYALREKVRTLTEERDELRA